MTDHPYTDDADLTIEDIAVMSPLARGMNRSVGLPKNENNTDHHETIDDHFGGAGKPDEIDPGQYSFTEEDFQDLVRRVVVEVILSGGDE